MSKLELWYNDCDFVVAETSSEATALCVQFTGCDAEDCACDGDDSWWPWPAPPIKWQFEEDRPHVEIAVADLCTKLGKGYAGTSEQ